MKCIKQITALILFIVLLCSVSYAVDSDGDALPDDSDNCPTNFNPNQEDGDGDGVGDVCDNCPNTWNNDQADADGDMEGDACDSTPNGPDADDDGVPDISDNCPTDFNPNQEDADGDMVGDACDPELCNFIDDNGDGQIDEGLGRGDSCTVGVGECEAEGIIICDENEIDAICNAVAGTPSTEICDQKDNDCDGSVDENGACGGEELCDGIDDDNDGSIDENFDLGEPCYVGKGECRREGVTVCDESETDRKCNATAGTPSAEICDQKDNDCDGSVDEGGVCLLLRELCNGIDDNNNGQIDEGFNVGQPCDGPDSDSCMNGVYACAANGGVECVNDNPSDIAETCDGVDNDCDGIVDEDCPVTRTDAVEWVTRTVPGEENDTDNDTGEQEEQPNVVSRVFTSIGNAVGNFFGFLGGLFRNKCKGVVCQPSTKDCLGGSKATCDNTCRKGKCSSCEPVCTVTLVSDTDGDGIADDSDHIEPCNLSIEGAVVNKVSRNIELFVNNDGGDDLGLSAYFSLRSDPPPYAWFSNAKANAVTKVTIPEANTIFDANPWKNIEDIATIIISSPDCSNVEDSVDRSWILKKSQYCRYADASIVGARYDDMGELVLTVNNSGDVDLGFSAYIEYVNNPAPFIWAFNVEENTVANEVMSEIYRNFEEGGEVSRVVITELECSIGEYSFGRADIATNRLEGNIVTNTNQENQIMKVVFTQLNKAANTFEEDIVLDSVGQAKNLALDAGFYIDPTAFYNITYRWVSGNKIVITDSVVQGIDLIDAPVSLGDGSRNTQTEISFAFSPKYGASP